MAAYVADAPLARTARQMFSPVRYPLLWCCHQSGHRKTDSGEGKGEEGLWGSSSTGKLPRLPKSPAGPKRRGKGSSRGGKRR